MNPVKLLRLPALLLSGFFSTAAYPMDLVDSYLLAVENSSELAAARALSEASALDQDIARADLYPTLTLDASSRRINKFKGAADTTLDRGSVVITQPIWSESLGSWLDAAAETGVLARLQYQKAQTALLRQVVDAYFGVLAAQDSLDTAQREIASITTLRDYARVRRSAGVGTETDVRLAESRLALANATVIAAEATLDSTLLSLAELIGEKPLALTALAESVSLPQLAPGQSQRWVESALDNNIDILIQQVTVSIASHSIRISSAESDLRINLSGRVEHKFGGTESIDNHTTAMLSLSKSFTAFGRASNQRKQAAFRYEAELQKLQSEKNRTITRTSTLYRRSTNLIDQVEALELALIANESVLEITQSNYEVGLVTSLAVLDAQQDVFEVRSDLLKARYDFFRHMIALEQLAGTLDVDDLESLNQLLN